MISTGNDIVSLSAINITRTKQYRFYSKILSHTEKTLYNQAAFATIPFENFVWLLWSIKESAYKYLKRLDPNLVFIPLKFVVCQLMAPSGYTLTNFEPAQMEGSGFENTPAFTGVITLGPYKLYSASLMYRELIVSVVNGNDNFENTCWGVKSIQENDAGNQSKEVRMLLVERLQALLHFQGLVVSKNSAGIPIVLKEGEELGVMVSLSHHEGFVGYSVHIEHY